MLSVCLTHVQVSESSLFVKEVPPELVFIYKVHGYSYSM